jgi:hypothetical protein
MTTDKNPKARGYWLVAELAERAEVSGARVRQLLLNQVIRGDKAGQVWTIPYHEGERWLADRERDKQAE